MVNNKSTNTPVPPLFGYGAADKRPLVHFIGIGGIGVSSLAQWFLSQNWAVSGSDVISSPIIEGIRKRGITVRIGHKKGNLRRRVDLVIYSQAVTTKNPELREARRLGVPVRSYPEMAGHLTHLYRTIAVAGAHGKSTVTGILSTVLIRANLDPTVIIGTKLKEFNNTNFRFGKGRYLILEADEYGGAFWHYSPALAVITNIDREHLDFYKNLEGVKRGFMQFIANIRKSGTIVLNRDDRNLRSLAAAITKTAKETGAQILWYSLKQPLSKRVEKALQISGRHNVSNALAAITAASTLGIPVSQALQSVRAYQGSWRRMEYKGRLEIACPLRVAKQGGRGNWKLEVYDDYAHHPTEIKATLTAFKEKFSDSRIICVFQPHQAERLKILFKDFQKAFDLADITLILPVYRVAGRDAPSRNFDSRALVRAIQRKQPKKLLFYLEKPESVKRALTTLLTSKKLEAKSQKLKAVAVMMGAGDIVNYTSALLRS